jgi:hypothetical protein
MKAYIVSKTMIGDYDKAAKMLHIVQLAEKRNAEGVTWRVVNA